VKKLIGHFVRASGSSVVFQSDALGEITVEWSKPLFLHADLGWRFTAFNIAIAGVL
jgi:hypothetical protein